MAENFSKSQKNMDTKIQEIQQLPSKKNPKRPTPRYIIFKLLKVKDKNRILKISRAKLFMTYKGSSVRFPAGFSGKTLSAQKSSATGRKNQTVN
jgi:hypothetical protein